MRNRVGFILRMPKQLRADFLVLFTLLHLNHVCAPKAKEYGQELWGMTNLLAELARPSERSLHFGCHVPLHLQVHPAQGELQLELVPSPFLRVREIVSNGQSVA